ncbi:hypothetical protein [Halalkalicoccus ordinarius]|uniref:hypothetical protein n=1 Tax=Halalkalicoccus ordinarius TaxID=3116651 RepID=UPI00300F5A49
MSWGAKMRSIVSSATLLFVLIGLVIGVTVFLQYVSQQTIFTDDLTTNIFSGLLVAFTYLLYAVTRKQTSISESQRELLKLTYQPQLQLRIPHVEGNEINILIKNKGKGIGKNFRLRIDLKLMDGTKIEEYRRNEGRERSLIPVETTIENAEHRSAYESTSEILEPGEQGNYIVKPQMCVLERLEDETTISTLAFKIINYFEALGGAERLASRYFDDELLSINFVEKKDEDNWLNATLLAPVYNPFWVPALSRMDINNCVYALSLVYEDEQDETHIDIIQQGKVRDTEKLSNTEDLMGNKYRTGKVSITEGEIRESMEKSYV